MRLALSGDLIANAPTFSPVVFLKLHLYDKISNYVGFVEDNKLYDNKGKLVKANISNDSKIALLISILLSRKEKFVV
jgi:hypothetical protein